MRPAPARDRWALVTGASSGIGLALARTILERGGKVLLVARGRDRLEALATDLGHLGEVRWVAADLTTDEGRRQTLSAVEALPEPVTHLVNNAGFGYFGKWEEEPWEDLAGMLQLNMATPLWLSQQLLPALRTQRGGILHVASLAAYSPAPYMAVYAASKAFLHSFALAQREELRPQGVSVTSLCPGPVPTSFGERSGFHGTTGPLAVLPRAVALGAWCAYERGQALYLPGLHIRAARTLAAVLPLPLRAKATALIFRGLGRR